MILRRIFICLAVGYPDTKIKERSVFKTDATFKQHIIRSYSLTSGRNRPLQMTLEDQINILVYFHLEEHHSGRHLLQVLKENHFARQYIAPEKGISKSSFFEDISSRGLEQMLELFEKLYAKAASQLPKGHSELGDLTIIDGSLIDSVLSMYWADYRDGAKKAKVHIGFDLNRGIPKKIFLTDGLIFLFDKTLLSLEVSIGKPHLYVKAILTTEREKTVLSSIVCN